MGFRWLGGYRGLGSLGFRSCTEDDHEEQVTGFDVESYSYSLKGGLGFRV